MRSYGNDKYYKLYQTYLMLDDLYYLLFVVMCNVIFFDREENMMIYCYFIYSLSLLKVVENPT